VESRRRLVQVKGGLIAVCATAYDSLHRRVKRHDWPTSGGDVRHFYYNKRWQCLEERATEGGAPTRQYVWRPHYVDALALTYDGSGNEHYYAQDANSNVTAVLNDSGVVLERYAYTPYGEATILDSAFANPSSTSAIGNEFLYTGRRRDPETGLQYNRNRFYHPQLGRWVNRDPIGYGGG